MPTVLRWLAFLAFVLAALAALPPPGARLARVPWLPIGLALWVLADLASAGAFDLDVD
jgi:hypothetical protein